MFQETTPLDMRQDLCEVAYSPYPSYPTVGTGFVHLSGMSKPVLLPPRLENYLFFQDGDSYVFLNRGESVLVTDSNMEIRYLVFGPFNQVRQEKDYFEVLDANPPILGSMTDHIRIKRLPLRVDLYSEVSRSFEPVTPF